MTAQFSMLEEFAADNTALVHAANDALEALNEGRLHDLRHILEQMARPKWLSLCECQNEFELEMGR